MKLDGVPHSSSRHGRHPTYYVIKDDLLATVSIKPIMQSEYIKDAMDRFQCAENSIRRPIIELISEGKITTQHWFKGNIILKPKEAN